jgi:hypothetical protein
MLNRTERLGELAVADIISGFKNHFQLELANGQTIQLGRLNLPSGSYSIWAKLYTGIPRPEGFLDTLHFRLQAGNDFDDVIVTHDGQIPNVAVALNVVHTFSAPGAAVLTCRNIGPSSNETDLHFIKITAVSGASFTNAPLP